MIQSFGDQFTRDIWDGLSNTRTRRFPQDLLPIARRKLDMLNAAHDLNDLRAVRGNRLESLKGDLKGFYSIRINDQWRILFKWTRGGPSEVKINDYH